MAGLALGLAFLSGFGFGASAVVVWLGVAAVLILRSHLPVMVVMAILAAVVGGSLYAQRESHRPMPAAPAGAFEGRLRVVDGPFRTQTGQRFTAAVPGASEELLCVYTASALLVRSGDLVAASGQITRLEDLSTVGRAAAMTRDCGAQLRAEALGILEPGHGLQSTLSRYRSRLSQFLMRAAPGDAGALLSGLVTGDDGALSRDASTAFLSSGTTHITAISGANFATLVVMLGILANGAMRRSLAFVAAASFVIWTYALLVGLQPSAFRAALLATAVLLARWLGRIPDLLTLSVLLAALQVLIRPHDFDTLAFQLSLASTVALVVVFDGRERTGNHAWAYSVMFAVFAAQLATLPVLAVRIGSVSGIGLFANLLVGPLAALAFPLAFLGALVGQINETLGDATLEPAILLARMIIAFVSWSYQRLPASVQLGAPTRTATAMLTFTAWGTIFWMSGDLRRMVRDWRSQMRRW